MSDFEWIHIGIAHYAAIIGPFRADVYKAIDGKWKAQMIAGGVRANVFRDNAPDAQNWCMNFALQQLEIWADKTRVMLLDFPLTLGW